MNTWFIVEVTDSDPGPEPLGEMMRFAVSPRLQVNLEVRSNDEIMYAATEKAYDVAYGASRFHREKIRRAILNYLRYTLFVQIRNDFDVCVEPVISVTVRP